MGGPNSDQVIEHVKSFDPRSWTCLHAAEGEMNCTSMVIRNNEIGPCGIDSYDEWADGISVACSNTTILNNTVEGPTDGGIVIFGSPGSIVQKNTIRVGKHALLGGIVSYKEVFFYSRD
jgi:parallel beta-helix repeat protein